MRIGILGYGEIGKAIHSLYKRNDIYNVSIRDLSIDNELKNLDVLNICIPCVDNFVDIVTDVALESSAKTVIIHSTVRVGTTSEIQRRLNCLVSHSPVRGIHPFLLEGILTFVKFVGSSTYETSKIVADHLQSLGLNVEILESSKETELGKLFDTTYYGVCIAWHGEMKKICDSVGVSFENTVTMFNTTYNSGYSKLNKTNVIRPVLHPPVDGIGGHCVTQNAKLLTENFASEALDLIMKYSR